MKKICKVMAVFAIMVGLICMASCVSVGELVGSVFGGGGQTVAALDGRKNGAKYDSINLLSNGKVEAHYPDSVDQIKGKWESSKNTDHVGTGDTITVTIEEKTGTGTVRHVSSKFVHDTAADSAGDYTLITYSVNLGTLGTYIYEVEDYGR